MLTCTEGEKKDNSSCESLAFAKPNPCIKLKDIEKIKKRGPYTCTAVLYDIQSGQPCVIPFTYYKVFLKGVVS